MTEIDGKSEGLDRGEAGPTQNANLLAAAQAAMPEDVKAILEGQVGSLLEDLASLSKELNEVLTEQTRTKIHASTADSTYDPDETDSHVTDPKLLRLIVARTSAEARYEEKLEEVKQPLVVLGERLKYLKNQLEVVKRRPQGPAEANILRAEIEMITPAFSALAQYVYPEYYDGSLEE